MFSMTLASRMIRSSLTSRSIMKMWPRAPSCEPLYLHRRTWTRLKARVPALDKMEVLAMIHLALTTSRAKTMPARISSETGGVDAESLGLSFTLCRDVLLQAHRKDQKPLLRGSVPCCKYTCKLLKSPWNAADLEVASASSCPIIFWINALIFTNGSSPY